MRRFLTQLAVATAYVALIAVAVPRAYQITDDAVLTAAERGGDLVPHVGPAWSWALIRLYHAAPGVPWHGLSLYAAVAIALAVALSQVDARTAGWSERGRGARAAMAVRAVVMIAFFPAIATPTYTMSAILIGGAGVLVVLDGLDGRRGLIGAAAWGGALFAIGYLIRVESPPAPLVALAPWLVRSIVGYARRRPRPRIAEVAAAIALCGGPYAVARLTGPVIVDAQPAAVREFFAYNDVRFRIHLQGRFIGLQDRDPQLLERAGWSARDYEMFEHWIYLDEDRYPRDKLARLYDTGGELPPVAAGTLITDLRKAFVLRPGTYLVLAAAAIALWLARRRALGDPRARTIEHVVTLAYLVIAFVAVLLVSRMPARIADTLTCLATVGILRAVLGQLVLEDDRPPPWRGAVAIAALPIAAAVVLAIRLPMLDTSNQVAPAVKAKIASLGDPLLVVYAQAGLDADPLHADPWPYPHIGLGWEIFSPAWYRELAHHGLHRASELPAAVVDRANAYVLVVPRYAERVRADVSTLLGRELELVPVWTSPEAGRATVGLYQFHRPAIQ